MLITRCQKTSFFGVADIKLDIRRRRVSCLFDARFVEIKPPEKPDLSFAISIVGRTDKYINTFDR
jgi:hypothetical protein